MSAPIRVVTRYGHRAHLALPSLEIFRRKDARHYALCLGTSAWTVESWEATPDHPSLTLEQIRALPSCERCEALR